MNKYKIPDERFIKEAPNKLVVGGRAIFGSFRSSINNINLLDIHRQCRLLPDFCNSLRLTEWEAFELNTNSFTIVLAIYKNMKYNDMGILVYYDKSNNKIYSFRRLLPSGMVKVAPNLLGTEGTISLKNYNMKIFNDFSNKRVNVLVDINDRKNGALKMEIEGVMCAPSSIVSIPLGENKPLYSEKAIFRACGSVSFNGVTTKVDNGYAIIDDHKGYYPYRSHYDWLTTMGEIAHNGEIHPFGFNLTANQSLDEEKYNENNIWYDNKYYYLPPVKFIYKDKNTWLIKDEYGHVNLEFKILNDFYMASHAIVIDIKYHLPFGLINGYLKAVDGEVFEINNLTGIAENKTTRL